jgi:hypothetical protein
MVSSVPQRALVDTVAEEPIDSSMHESTGCVRHKALAWLVPSSGVMDQRSRRPPVRLAKT